jgi:hypothetical protein
MLADYITWLSREPETAKAIGRRAAAHIAAHHGLETVAGLYWEALSSTGS